MTYMLRDRPDGMVEIVLSRPILIGIFPERDVAQRFCSWLRDESIDWPIEEPALSEQADPDSDPAEMMDEGEAQLRAMIDQSRNAPTKSPPPRPVRNLPVLVPERPVAPAFLTAAPVTLTAEQKDAAFARITNGEKISAVAKDVGLSTGQLQGFWSQHKRRMQSHIAEGGKIACALCRTPFMPSVSHPETCARCSHE